MSVCGSVGWSVHLFGPDSNILTAIGWIVTDSHSTQRLNLTLSDHEVHIWYRDSCRPQHEVYEQTQNRTFVSHKNKTIS